MDYFSLQSTLNSTRQRRNSRFVESDNNLHFGIAMPCPIRSRRRTLWSIWFVCCICSLPSYAAANAVLRAKIVAYGSGSAFAVLDQREKLKRIKLAGVDSPEQRQRFGPQARHLAAEWLGASAFEIIVDKTDKDGRIHGRVVVDGHDVGLELIKAGLAWCDPADIAAIPQAVREKYERECLQAKAQRRGLWLDQNPTPPWEQRKIPQFDPLPGAKRPAGRSCREIGYQSVQCDDGKTYRIVGSQVLGSDGTTYSRRGNTLTGSDGNRFEQQGTSIYGTDGTVCRTRGKRTDCY
jgi:endonuclease YncB( thermonuclease family)